MPTTYTTTTTSDWFVPFKESYSPVRLKLERKGNLVFLLVINRAGECIREFEPRELSGQEHYFIEGLYRRL